MEHRGDGTPTGAVYTNTTTASLNISGIMISIIVILPIAVEPIDNFFCCYAYGESRNTVQPGTITHSNTMSRIKGQAYNISAVAGATTYTWNRSYRLDYYWRSRNDLCKCNNRNSRTEWQYKCIGWQQLRNKYTKYAGCNCISAGTPAQPGTIAGTATQCPGLTSQAYSISAVTNATTYTWTVPTGWIITGGAGTTSINVTTGTFGR